MNRVKCTVTLLSDKSRKAVIQLLKDEEGELIAGQWKVIGLSGEGLRMTASDGIWHNANFSDILILQLPAGKIGFELFANKVKFNSLKDMFSGKSIVPIVTEDADLYNGNAPEQKVSCTLESMP